MSIKEELILKEEFTPEEKAELALEEELVDFTADLLTLKGSEDFLGHLFTESATVGESAG